MIVAFFGFIFSFVDIFFSVFESNSYSFLSLLFDYGGILLIFGGRGGVTDCFFFSDFFSSMNLVSYTNNIQNEDNIQ